MFICASIFTATTHFNNWIRAYMSVNASLELRNNALTSLDKTVKNGPRKMPPGLLEFDAKMNNTFDIHYEIETSIPEKTASLQLDSSMTIKEVIYATFLKLNLTAREGFGLKMSQEGVPTRLVDPGEFFFDVLSEVELVVYPDGDPELPVTPTFQLVKIFVDPDEEITDPIAVDLVYNQVIKELHVQDLITLPDDAAAAAAVQVAVGGLGKISEPLQ